MARPLCVHCRQREVDDRYRPFCSERCKLADLGRWLSGDYKVAGSATLDPDHEASPEETTVRDEAKPQTPY